MFLVFNLLLILFFIITGLFIGSKMISFKVSQDSQKISPFECGFDPQMSARNPFSLQFFLITIIFLIFDVEITLLLPLPYSLNHNSMLTLVAISFFFILILILGLFYEWHKEALNWKI